MESSSLSWLAINLLLVKRLGHSAANLITSKSG